MIDWHFQQWTAKPVAFASYGGAAGGRHAVLHLENVFTELHAVTIRDGLRFPNYFLTWSDGEPQVEQRRGLREVDVRSPRLVGQGAARRTGRRPVPLREPEPRQVGQTARASP